MARVTNEEVQAILETTKDTTPFITTANILVDAKLLDKGLSDDLLKQIELYLSAHFATSWVKQLKSEEFGDSKDEYLGVVGMGLKSSVYGQNALDLDCSGTLSMLGKVKATIDVL